MLNFNYSWIYDQQIHWWRKKKYNPDSYKKSLNYIKNLENKWRVIESEVFSNISRVSGLKWKNKNIECYIVTDLIYPFSMPLTISVCTDINHQVEVLIHELIHNLWIQNENKVVFRDYKKYGKLNYNTKIHILVNAIENEVLMKLFGYDKTQKYIKFYEKYPDYKKSWNIVEKEGSENIIKEWIKC